MRPHLILAAVLALSACAGENPGVAGQVGRAVGQVGAAVLGVPGAVGGAIGGAAGAAATTVEAPEQPNDSAAAEEGGMDGDGPAE